MEALGNSQVCHGRFESNVQLSLELHAVGVIEMVDLEQEAKVLHSHNNRLIQ